MSEPVIVVERAFGDLDPERAAAAAHGVRIEGSDARTAEAFAHDAHDADGVIVRYLPLGAELLADVPWRVIGRYGIGVDNVDLAAASARGAAVVNVPDYCVDEVAVHAAALVLAAWRRLPAAAALVRSGRWDAWETLAPIGRLSQATLGIVGLGRIGARVAELLAPAFGRVLGSDPLVTSAPPGVALTDLDALVAEADAISLHCPLTPATHHLFGAARLAAMRPGSLLVNVSRGELVDVEALLAALDVGRPAHAALDVLGQEPPPPGAAHVGHPRILLTNHVAWYSEQSLVELRHEIAARCAARLRGLPVASIVNAGALAEDVG